MAGARQPSTGAVKIAPLAFGPGNHYLLKDGVPWLINEFAGGWAFFQAVSNADSLSYFSTMAAAGFNAGSVSIIYNDQLRLGTPTGNHFGGPNWNNGSTVPPFTTPGDFSTSGATYQAHVLDRAQLMESLDIVGLYTVCYPGFGGDGGTSNQGFAADMVADTNAHMQAYGTSIANLLAGIKKLVWVIGGDVAFTGAGAPNDILTRSMALVSGVRGVDPKRMWAAHLGGSNTGIMPYQHGTISTIPNMLQSMYRYADDIERAWWGVEQAWPYGPVWQFDPAYEDDPGPAEDRTRLRYRTQSTLCSGACGMSYSRGDPGDGLAWYEVVANGWLTNRAGYLDHIYAYKFWKSIPWWSMFPDFTSQFMTAGRGTHSSTSDNYITCRASNECLVAFFQNGAGNTVTVDFSKFTGKGWVSPAGSRIAQWLDPTADPTLSSSYTPISGSPFATSGTQTFTQPAGANSTGTTNDRLLVIW